MDPVHQPDADGNTQLQLPGSQPPIVVPVVSKADIDLVIGDVANANSMGQYIDRLKRQCETESTYNPGAHNKASDCYGLFQLAAATAKEFGVNRYDWRDNIVGGIKYMRWLLNYYKGDYSKALAGYNWGLGNLNKIIKAYGDKWLAAHELPKETANYVAKII